MHRPCGCPVRPTHHVAVLHAQLRQAGTICLQVVDAAGVLGCELQGLSGSSRMAGRCHVTVAGRAKPAAAT